MAKSKIKRFKIVEQMGLVVIISVLIPLIIAGFIVNNVNQHAIRKELHHSANMLAQNVAKNVDSLTNVEIGALNEIALALKYLPSEYAKNIYLTDILINTKNFKSLNIKSKNEIKNQNLLPDKLVFAGEDVILYRAINSESFLVATIDLKDFNEKIFGTSKDNTREIYIISNKDHRLLTAYNYSENEYKKAQKIIPSNFLKNKSVIFSKIKNEPIAYYSMTNPDLTIIVNTTTSLTDKTIYTARYKIILSILISAITIIFTVGIYTYYLYINIRQLFKGIIAMSKGNYKRKIRLLTSVFTPYEILFLASEINKMIDEVNISYKKVHQKNKELKQINNFRQNLVDTVSHEFRTPLTSIKGYTSRLLRKDIIIDEDTKIKSLNIIKQQSDRLSRMVEDLLVIPDIEGSKLNIKMEMVNLNEAICLSIESLKNIDERQINIKPFNYEINVFADKDRLIQILINLFENANKYAYENTPIEIKVIQLEQKVKVEIINKANYIEKEDLNRLFEKFTRIDDKTTRTTRGTGLGLFIVKGLVQAMNAKIVLQSNIDNTFKTILIFQSANK